MPVFICSSVISYHSCGSGFTFPIPHPNSLVKKGYVIRERGKEDRRVVYISLSEKGKKAYVRHQEFHLEMIKAMREGLSDEQCLVLLQAIKNLKEHLKTV